MNHSSSSDESDDTKCASEQSTSLPRASSHYSRESSHHSRAPSHFSRDSRQNSRVPSRFSRESSHISTAINDNVRESSHNSRASSELSRASRNSSRASSYISSQSQIDCASYSKAVSTSTSDDKDALDEENVEVNLNAPNAPELELFSDSEETQCPQMESSINDDISSSGLHQNAQSNSSIPPTHVIQHPLQSDSHVQNHNTNNQSKQCVDEKPPGSMSDPLPAMSDSCNTAGNSLSPSASPDR